MSLPTIFVQIASYRDPECQWTVKNLFEKAKFPERIFAGICWQFDEEHDGDCFVEPSPRPEQTRVVNVSAYDSQGVCWARHVAQTLYEGEDYVLMIDSHMRFIDDWDEALIDELNKCPSEKSFLSSYPPGYQPPNQLAENPMPTVLLAQDFNEQGDIRFKGETLYTKPDTPLNGAFLAGGQIFAPGAFVKEVAYDPFMYFNHEEITLAARAYTHGWDSYSPTDTFMYHLYHTGNAGRRLHWEDNKDWSHMTRVSRGRYNYLLGGQLPEHENILTDIDQYGLGSVRSLAEFEAYTGLDFKSKVSSERAQKGQFIKNIDAYRKGSST